MAFVTRPAQYNTTTTIISASIRSAIFNNRDTDDIHADRKKLIKVLKRTPQVIDRIFGYNQSCGYNSAIETIEHHCMLKSKFIEKTYGAAFYYSSNMAPIASDLSLVEESLTMPVREFFTTLIGNDIWGTYDEAIKTRYVSLSIDKPIESEPLKLHVFSSLKMIGLCTSVPIVSMKYFLLGYAQASIIIIESMSVQLGVINGEELYHFNSVIMTYHILLLRILDVLDELIAIDLKYGFID